MNDNWINLSELTWCNINHVCVYVCLFFLFVLCKLCRWVVPPGELFFWLTPWPLTFDGSKVKTCFNVQFHVLLRTKIKMAESLTRRNKRWTMMTPSTKTIGLDRRPSPPHQQNKTKEEKKFKMATLSDDTIPAHLEKSKHGRGFFYILKILKNLIKFTKKKIKSNYN